MESKVLYLGLWMESWKTIVIFLINALQIAYFQNIMHKLEFLNLEPKMPYLGVLGSSFEKPLSYLKSASLNLPCCKVSCKKIKILKFGTENGRFRYFGAGIWKNYSHIWNQRPRICLITKFGGKTKILKFGTKMHDLGIFEQEVEKYILIFEISTLESV